MTINTTTSGLSNNEPVFGSNEIDFDDEREEDQYPLDVVEAAEAGVTLLDDPEQLDEES